MSLEEVKDSLLLFLQAVSELQYLEKAVGLVLGVIAAKLACEGFDVQLLSPVQSLLVVLAILGGGVGLSLRAGGSDNKGS